MIGMLPLVILGDDGKPCDEKLELGRNACNVIRCFFHRLPEVMKLFELVADLNCE